MKGNTQKGLYYLIIGFLITAIFSAVNSISALVIKDIEALSVIGFFGIIAFFGFILVVAGAVFFLKGKKEFGETHQKNVEKAVIIFVLQIVITMALNFLLSMFTFSMIAPSSAPDAIAAVLLIIIITVTVVNAVVGGLLYYFALIELQNETGKTVLYAAIICSIVVSVLTSAYVAAVSGSASIAEIQSTNPFMQNPGIMGLLGLLPSLLYIYALYIPYTQIKNGELIAQLQSTDASSSDRFCTNCGRNIPFDAVACPYCAKRFDTY